MQSKILLLPWSHILFDSIGWSSLSRENLLNMWDMFESGPWGKGGTLVISLSWLWDADPKLAAVGVDSHHATVSWGAGKGWNLARIPGDTVEGFSNVCSSLQNDVLENRRVGWALASACRVKVGWPSKMWIFHLVIVWCAIQCFHEVCSSF